MHMNNSVDAIINDYVDLGGTKKCYTINPPWQLLMQNNFLANQL